MEALDLIANLGTDGDCAFMASALKSMETFSDGI
jgi:hypothetical protein